MAADKNTELLIALQNPKRRVILREVRKYPDGVSPSELAVHVGEPLSNTGYHCRVLRDSGAIALVEQKAVRGAIKSYYRFALADSWALAMLSQEEGAADDSAPDLDP
jgi:DNA-binding transcriptional ArsR family regulator